MLSNFACHPENSKGRLYKEEPSLLRTPYQRDRDRIIHSNAFRRLKHKTQVFIEHEGDHFRTRLTHSIEVSQVARTIANVLKINSDLTEAIALAHDLGHTPFGHTGEETLDNCMKNFGGFDHNVQTLRIITLLEKNYAEFNGLNLTWETLDGVLKHSGPLKKDMKSMYSFFNRKYKLDVDNFSSLEGQVASISDDIAYNSHDLDDGLRANLFSFEDVAKLPLIDKSYNLVNREYSNENNLIKQKHTLRLFFNNLVLDTIDQTKRNLKRFFSKPINSITVHDVRNCRYQIVTFSDGCAKELDYIRGFLFEKMYRHKEVEYLRGKSKVIVEDLFKILIKNVDLMPLSWTNLLNQEYYSGGLNRLVADYISGMTDRYAIQRHSRLTGLKIFP